MVCSLNGGTVDILFDCGFSCSKTKGARLEEGVTVI